MSDGPVLEPPAVKCVREIYISSRASVDIVLKGNSRRPDDRFSIICYLDCPLSSPCSMESIQEMQNPLVDSMDSVESRADPVIIPQGASDHNLKAGMCRV